MRFATLKHKSSKLIISTLLLAGTLVYLPTISAKADVISETDGTEYLKVDSPIVIEFDKPIQFASGDMAVTLADIQLLDITDETNPIPNTIELEIAGNKLIVNPTADLKQNKDYRLDIKKDIVVSDPAGGFVFGDGGTN